MFCLRKHHQEAKGMLISRAATFTKDGRKRKSMFTHAKEAHITLFCDRDVTCNYKRNLGALQDFVANWCSGYMDLDQQLRIGENVFRPQGRSRV